MATFAAHRTDDLPAPVSGFLRATFHLLSASIAAAHEAEELIASSDRTLAQRGLDRSAIGPYLVRKHFA
ncbi:hypothetical protein [Halodurantibacterium flavum]|uniref:DUF1127 domain-containing protein n=1 Tax=Halodurantibacterium flavum TaxID=1382802 RepID=A0ABW4S0K8_9RHOB